MAGIFYQPPNPNIGAQQPLAPREFTPPSGPPPQNPPFPGAAALALTTIISVAWLPPQPQPPSARNLPPTLTVSVPPVNGGAQVPEAVLVAWLPPQPDPYMGMGSVGPLEQTKFTPSGPTPQNPPVTGPVTGLPLAVQDAWLPPPPGPYQGNEQQFAQEVLSPPISGSTPQNPPVNGGAAVPLAVLDSWLPPDPRPQWSPPVPASAMANYPPPGGAAAVPGAVLVAWLPGPPQPQQAPLATPTTPLPPSYVTTGALVPLPVQLSWDWAPRWPWARTPVVTPSGPAPQNPPFPGTKVGVDVQTSWLPPQPQPITGPLLVQAAPAPAAYLPPRQPGAVEIAVSWLPPQPLPELNELLTPPSNPVPSPLVGASVPSAVMVWWSIPAPPQPQQAPIQAFQTPPPVQGAISVPYAVMSWWQLPPPMPIVARNLDPPIQGPAPQNPPFMGGARVPPPVLVDWIPPPPMPPAAWRATHAFLPPPGASLRFDPRFLTTPRVRYQLSSPRPRLTVTTPRTYGMPQGNDFSDADTAETVTDTWNFSPWLGAGVTLTTPVTTTIALRSGVDAAPSSRLLATPNIVSSPVSGLASQAVQQQVQGLQPGACYILTATAATSDGQVLNVWAYQRGKQPS